MLRNGFSPVVLASTIWVILVILLSQMKTMPLCDWLVWENKMGLSFWIMSFQQWLEMHGSARKEAWLDSACPLSALHSQAPGSADLEPCSGLLRLMFSFSGSYFTSVCWFKPRLGSGKGAAFWCSLVLHRLLVGQEFAWPVGEFPLHRI